MNKPQSSGELKSNEGWSPHLYDEKHSFVCRLARDMIEALQPTGGMRVLDVGCGTGHLTHQIAECGAQVLGIDSSATMIKRAQLQFPSLEFRLQDEHHFKTEQPFDAIFSNAALHWIHTPNHVVECLSKALTQKGRLVVEFGGDGNISCLTQAIQNAHTDLQGHQRNHPWYFPSIAEFTTILSEHGLETTHAKLTAQPTQLAGNEGRRDWVRMFGSHWLDHLAPSQHEPFLERIEENARPTLYDGQAWHADYRRLRVVAIKVE